MDIPDQFLASIFHLEAMLTLLLLPLVTLNTNIPGTQQCIRLEDTTDNTEHNPRYKTTMNRMPNMPITSPPQTQTQTQTQTQELKLFLKEQSKNETKKKWKTGNKKQTPRTKTPTPKFITRRESAKLLESNCEVEVEAGVGVDVMEKSKEDSNEDDEPAEEEERNKPALTTKETTKETARQTNKRAYYARAGFLGQSPDPGRLPMPKLFRKPPG